MGHKLPLLIYFNFSSPLAFRRGQIQKLDCPYGSFVRHSVFRFFSNWYGWVALRSGSVLRTLPEGECEAGTPTYHVYTLHSMSCIVFAVLVHVVTVPCPWALAQVQKELISLLYSQCVCGCVYVRSRKPNIPCIYVAQQVLYSVRCARTCRYSALSVGTGSSPKGTHITFVLAW